MTTTLKQCPKCGATVPSEAPQGLCPRCVLGEVAVHQPQSPAAHIADVPSLERVATAFPQLEIVELIGRGGMGFVFKARQPHLDRFVALKLLPDKLAGDPNFAERFGREGRVLARLNHPNIVSVFDFGQAGGFYFLLMEFVDGVNLRQAMGTGKFSPAEALAIVPKICEALQYAHEKGVLHRDIKPENILLDANGRVKIADFGIAKLIGEDKPALTLTGTGTALGTPHYMAPEQLEKPGDIDHRVDIYSLGVVFYEMLTGELPIGRFKPPSARTPLDERIDEIVLRALERERELRQRNATEFKTQVEHVASHPAPPGESVGARGPHGTAVVATRYSHKAIWAASLAGASLLFLSFIIAARMFRFGEISPIEKGTVIALSTVIALVGTILGWVAMSDIRAHHERLRGLPLAAFGALAWPVVVLLAGSVLAASPYIYYLRGMNTPRPLAALFLMAVAAGLPTFAIWMVYTTTRWAGGQPQTQQRGVLRWIFAALVLFGVAVLSASMVRKAGSQAAGELEAAQITTDTNAWVRFTFTAVEFREEGEKRWLAFDYVDHIQGVCEPAFRYESTVVGFIGQTRKSSFLVRVSEPPPVRHQRIEFLLPPSTTTIQGQQFRNDLKHYIAKSVKVDVGSEKPLFVLDVEDGTISGSIGAVRPLVLQ
jgi:hypothetical protein